VDGCNVGLEYPVGGVLDSGDFKLLPEDGVDTDGLV
jgi:hypothetical protein